MGAVDVDPGPLAVVHRAFVGGIEAAEDAIAQPQEKRVVEKELRNGMGCPMVGLVSKKCQIFLNRN